MALENGTALGRSGTNGGSEPSDKSSSAIDDDSGSPTATNSSRPGALAPIASPDGDEFELVVERRRTDVNDARVVLEVRLDGARESWRHEDRRWLRLDDAGALLGEIDLGQLRTRARWSDPGGSSWAVFEGASGRLAPRIGPVAWREESGASIELVRLGSDRNRDSEPLAAR